MNSKCKKYLKLLKLELDDLKDDATILIDEMNKKHNEKNISHFVYLENITLLKKEILDIDSLEKWLLNIDISKFQTVEELNKYIINEFKEKIKKHNIIEEIYFLIERKFNKIKII